LFRFYDPRVLRAFLPVCKSSELVQFFGPVAAFHCQTEEPGSVVSFTLEREQLRISDTPLAEFLNEHFSDRVKCAPPPVGDELHNYDD
jgi:hypothetical protein